MIARVKPTPGPWRCEPSPEWGNAFDIFSYGYHPDQQVGVGLATVYGESVSGNVQENAVANAQLVAACPDLLDACRTVYRLLDAKWEGRRSDAERGLLLTLEQAIAKAEGREP